jgi:hypothetical protein
MGRAKIEAAGHSAVITHSPEIDTEVPVGVGMKQAADPPMLFSDQPHEWAVVEIFERTGSASGLCALTECRNVIGLAGNPRKIFCSLAQHRHQGTISGIGHIVESAASGAGNLSINLTEVDPSWWCRVRNRRKGRLLWVKWMSFHMPESIRK